MSGAGWVGNFFRSQIKIIGKEFFSFEENLLIKRKNVDEENVGKNR